MKPSFGRHALRAGTALLAAMSLLALAAKVPAEPAAQVRRSYSGQGLLPAHLRCEYAVNPLGIDAPQPQLSWQLESGSRSQKQSAYHVLVASTPALLQQGRGDLWDSGKIAGEQSSHITYNGKQLSSRRPCFWKVRVWDQRDRVSRWSANASWEMGLLEPSDWRAQWIGAGPAHEPRPPAGFFKSTNELALVNQPVKVDSRSVLLRKSFELTRPIRQARVHVTGLGYYELSCNGQRVGNHVLAPAKSNYRKWVLYDTHDVTSCLKPGANALGVHLGNGWFNPAMKWWEPYRMQWFGSKRALVQLHVDYADGSSETIVSDESWQTAPGPVLAACVFDGEMYDATQERPGWDRAETETPDWVPAVRMQPPGGRLQSHLMPPIRVVERLKPIRLSQPKPGVFIFDLGQNFAGWAKLTASGPRGTRIQIRYAEDLLPDGNLDVTSNERAISTDVYVMKGIGTETYEPRFTFHGFRYVEVTGLPREPKLEHLVGCVVHTDSTLTGSFTCDNDLINRIHRATQWSQRSNLMGYPMDCPQRDERLGWFGDALVSMEEAMYNFDLPLFYRQWLDGVRQNQNSENGDISIISPRPYMTEEPDPAWSSAYVLMVWQYYVHYGDHRFLARHFDSMKRYVDFLGTQATNHILPKYWIGDWGTILKDWKEGEPESVCTAFYYYDSLTLAKAAQALGKPQEAAHYNELAARIRAAYNRAFFKPDPGYYEQGSQFSNAFPLYLGLVEPADEPRVLRQVLSDLASSGGRFNVGVLGAKYLIDALTVKGRPDAAYALATQTGFPSWAHMLENGRTTLSEFWTLKGSHNHVMMGSIDGWFYRTLAGIHPDERQPGFRHMVIRPFLPETLRQVQSEVQTPHGPVSVQWQKRAGTIRLAVSLPPNTTATIHVPDSPGAKHRHRPSLKPVRREPQSAIYEIGSGRYEFTVQLPGKPSGR